MAKQTPDCWGDAFVEKVKECLSCPWQDSCREGTTEEAVLENALDYASEPKEDEG